MARYLSLYISISLCIYNCIWNLLISIIYLTHLCISVKNFQLVDPDAQEAVVLQFGRVGKLLSIYLSIYHPYLSNDLSNDIGKDEFTMDFQWPISPFQGIYLSISI
jgi:hypothetical protein